MAGMKPRELQDKGLIDGLSMLEYTVDREAIEAALGQDTLRDPQQGGEVDVRTSQPMRHAPTQQPFGGKPVSNWVNPWG